MNIVLTIDDLAAFSTSTRNEILRHFAKAVGGLPATNPMPAPEWRDQIDDVDTENLEELTLKQIRQWMRGISETVEKGVKIIAEHGPLIEAHRLTEVGINIRQFQSATTKRTRKVTGDRETYFLAWNRWNGMDDPHGKYAVSPITHQSLCRYFGLAV